MIRFAAGSKVSRKVHIAWSLSIVCCLLLFLSMGWPALARKATPPAEFDLVILGGRVMDPETGLDAVRNVGIRGGKIQAITTGILRGKSSIDAKGLVVAPGFIDLHAHGQDEENYNYYAMDGVTTALELEIGVADIDHFYADREGKALINYGASVGHVPLRMELMHDPALGRSILPSGDGAKRPATEEDIAMMKEGISRGLQRGGLGVGFGIQYISASSRHEILEMFGVAGGFGATCFVHLRSAGAREPSNGLQGLEEVIAASAISGAPLHVVHITSMGLKVTPQLLAMITGARAHGLDVTTECYPYSAAQTDLASEVFSEGWQEAMGISYGDLQWVLTGERLTADTFAKYRKIGGMVVIHSIPEDVVRLAISSPITMIASDAFIHNGAGHPRAAGTFARVLGRYVREEKVISLMDGLKKMTLMPAQRLEKYAPVFKNKGRIRVGADADITIFDPTTVIDKATYEQPANYSAGIEYVLVNGVAVVEGGKLKAGAHPGKGARAPIRTTSRPKIAK
jgi:N-acyl-D-aspartate/D-glutamate deacylase